MRAYFTLFAAFFVIGLLSFGGGMAIIPFLEAEALSRSWLTAAEIPNMIAISQTVPGAIAVNMAAFVGFTLYRLPGVFWAVLGVSLPSFALMSAATHFISKVRGSRIIKGAFYGLRPAACGLIAASAIRMSFLQFFGGINISDVMTVRVGDLSVASIIIFAAALFCMLKLKINPVFVVLGAGVVGISLGLLGLI
ncbi:MAG: chromate transporter [Defluviitaleaceae bacterium]|nr:chromate transporter [Defluviitaleaceae bacterium]